VGNDPGSSKLVDIVFGGGIVLAAYRGET